MTVTELIRTDVETLASAVIDTLSEILGTSPTVSEGSIDSFSPIAARSGDGVSVSLSIPEEAGLTISSRLHSDPEETPEDLTVDDVVTHVAERIFDSVGAAVGTTLIDHDPVTPNRVIDLEFDGAHISVGLTIEDKVAESPIARAPAGVGRLADVRLDVKVELGRSRIAIKDLLALDEGGVIRLARPVGDPVDLVVNGTVTAHGEIVVVDGRLGLKITSLA